MSLADGAENQEVVQCNWEDPEVREAWMEGWLLYEESERLFELEMYVMEGRRRMEGGWREEREEKKNNPH